MLAEQTTIPSPLVQSLKNKLEILKGLVINTPLDNAEALILFQALREQYIVEDLRRVLKVDTAAVAVVLVQDTDKAECFDFFSKALKILNTASPLYRDANVWINDLRMKFFDSQKARCGQNAIENGKISSEQAALGLSNNPLRRSKAMFFSNRTGSSQAIQPSGPLSPKRVSAAALTSAISIVKNLNSPT